MMRSLHHTIAALCLSACILSCGYQRLIAQPHTNIADSMMRADVFDFDKICNTIDRYYAHRDQGKGSGYKQYARWRYKNSSRLDQSGRIDNFRAQNWESFYIDAKSTAQVRFNMQEFNSSFGGNWSLHGPNTVKNIGEASNYAVGTGIGVGRVNCIAFDPDNEDVLYVGTPAGGLFRSMDHGVSWTSLTDAMPILGISSLVIDPTSPANNRTIYIMTGDGDGADAPSLGVFKSIDNGRTWMSTGLFWPYDIHTIPKYAYKILIHPEDENTLFVVSNDGIYKTDDGAASWAKVAQGRFFDIEIKPGQGDIMYASGYPNSPDATASNLYRSLDGGNNWQVMKNVGLPQGARRRTSIAVTADNPEALYISDWGRNELYFSNNSGDNFSLRSRGHFFSGQENYNNTLAVSPEDENLVLIGYVNLFRSDDGGKTFDDYQQGQTPRINRFLYSSVHVDFHALEFRGNKLYAGSDGGIHYCPDPYRTFFTHGDVWQFLGGGLGIGQYYDIDIGTSGSNEVIGGSQDNGNQVIRDRDQYRFMQGDGVSAFARGASYFGSSQFGALVDKFDETTLTRTNIKPPSSGNGNFVLPFVKSTAADNTMLIGFRHLYKSSDNGENWSNIGSSISTGNITHIAPAHTDDDVIYISFARKVFATQNNGASWRDITVPGLRGNEVRYGRVADIEVNPDNSQELWVAYSRPSLINSGSEDNRLFHSQDGGITWTNITTDLPKYHVNCLKYHQGLGLFVGADIGVYYRQNGSSQWSPFDQGLPKTPVYDIEIDTATNQIFAGTYGRSIWVSDLPAELSDCEDLLSLTDPFVSSGNFSARQIVASSHTSSGISIDMKAEKNIVLSPGFHATSGTSFQAKIESVCSDSDPLASLSRSSYSNDLSGHYAGPMPRAITEVKLPSPMDHASEFSTFPNPTTGWVRVNYEFENDMDYSYNIYDFNGRRVDQGALSIANRDINLEDLNNGVYIIQLKALNDVIASDRLIVQR